MNPKCRISKLRMGDNKIWPNCAAAIARALELCWLSELYLDGCKDSLHNSIGSEGAIAIAEALESPYSRLEVLRIENNSIGIDGAIAFAKALEECLQKKEEGLFGPVGGKSLDD